ncbi:MAG: transcriptional repressor [Verrucomicrobia bacterium]|nr:transcriptional repressor [Verrucomicrobiota bacterium]MCH8526881.1 transcriptional repressor [Kiritimatiellia bacterium]
MHHEPPTEKTLRQAGLQVTAQRLAVLNALHDHPHALADELVQQVRDRIGSISRQAVYDALNLMSEKGLIHRIQPAGATARYEIRSDNHHHLVCRKCGAMRDTECGTGKAPCLLPKHTHGYEIDEAEVLYWGICPDCQAKNT